MAAIKKNSGRNKAAPVLAARLNGHVALVYTQGSSVAKWRPNPLLANKHRDLCPTVRQVLPKHSSDTRCSAGHGFPE